MKITTQKLALQLEKPFKLSYGTTTVRQNILVRLDDGAYVGYGEAAVVPYYGETAERVLGYLEDPALLAAVDGDAAWLQETLDRLPPTESGPARAAIDLALHDRWGQALGQPLYRLWGLNPAHCPLSSFTVSMAEDEDTYRANVREAQQYGIVKLKLGSGDLATDLRMVHIAREEISGQLCVDANAGWSAEEALDIIPRLAALDLLFVEQPVKRDDFDGWRALVDGLPPDRPPLIADESVQGVDSVPPLAGIVDGINIKLAKCGGLGPARRMIALARAYGLRVMIGCMVESSVAVTAAAHLAPLVDFADLDGNLLITNDPFRGMQMQGGRIRLPDGPGLGVAPVEAR